MFRRRFLKKKGRQESCCDVLSGSKRQNISFFFFCKRGKSEGSPPWIVWRRAECITTNHRRWASENEKINGNFPPQSNQRRSKKRWDVDKEECRSRNWFVLLLVFPSSAVPGTGKIKDCKNRCSRLGAKLNQRSL